MDFAELAAVFRKMEATTKRLEMTSELAELFRKASRRELRKLVYLCQGSLVPHHLGIELGIGEKLAVRAIGIVTGKAAADIEAHLRKSGDPGETAEELLQRKTQRLLHEERLTVEKVYDNFYRIATAGGGGSQELKIKLLSELLGNASPGEARLIVRFLISGLRVGVGEATIIDALSTWKAGDKSLRADLERAFNLRSDLGLVAELFAERGIEAVRRIGPEPFSPIRPALAERLPSSKEILEKLGPCLVEAKYDGLRLQVHKKGDKIELYTRRQERVTEMFPDIVAAVRKQMGRAKELIFEGEAIGFSEETGAYLPFQLTIQRKRKYEVAEKAEEIPLKLFAFEVLYLNGRDYTNEPYQRRREELERLVGKGDTILMAESVEAKDPKELDQFFDACVERGLEGVIAKDLKAPYTAGARKFAWVKLKRSYAGELAETLDLVIVGYYYGRGKRTKFGFGGLLTAAYDDRADAYKTVARIGTGFTEEQMVEYRKLLEKIAVKEKPKDVEALIAPHVWVQPKYVAVIKADEITRSPTHTAGMKKTAKGWEGEGLALRFPRIVQLRMDKGPRDATTEREVFKLYEQQRKRGLGTAGER
jgi:DNA ligase-1